MALDNIGISQNGKTGEFPSLYAALIDIFDDVVGQLRNSAEAKGLDASGNLLASITFRPEVLGDTMRFQLILPDYYKWVDEGRKPGKFPPIEPILQWMKQKGIVPRNTRGKRLKTTDKSLKNLAYIIRRSIAKKGTIKRFGYRGSNFYTDVIPSEKDFVRKITAQIADAARKDIVVQLKYFDK